MNLTKLYLFLDWVDESRKLLPEIFVSLPLPFSLLLSYQAAPCSGLQPLLPSRNPSLPLGDVQR